MIPAETRRRAEAQIAQLIASNDRKDPSAVFRNAGVHLGHSPA
jgi:hypothetical protein